MSGRHQYAAYALVALGLGALLVGTGSPSLVPGLSESLRHGLTVAGLLAAFLGGIAVDYLGWTGGSDGSDGADTHRNFVLSTLGVLLFLSVLFELGLPAWAQGGLALVGLLAVSAATYRRARRKLSDEYDERQVEIRYRATYTAFVVLNSLLLVSAVVAYVRGMSAGFLVVVPPIVVAALVLQFSEGWYARTM